jgi:hypothetical protein
MSSLSASAIWVRVSPSSSVFEPRGWTLGEELKKLEAMVKELEAYEPRYARFVSMVGA